MAWWSRLFHLTKAFSESQAKSAPALDVPLPILVHIHSKETLPPGPVEEGIVELEQDDVVLHAVAGIVQPDGTIGDLPEDKMEWARRLIYRHLRREGCLKEFGIPIIAAYEEEIAAEQRDKS